jgi:alpha-tubulin suppressor-like RCC1 family protein
MPTNYIPPVTGFKIGTADLGSFYVAKSYLIDRYPELASQYYFGGLYVWGYNQLGELGTNDTTSRSSPVQTVTTGTNWKQVSGGGDFRGAIKTDGTLWMWGRNEQFGTGGQLGTNDITDRSSPVQTFTGGTNWKQVDCGDSHTGAIKTDGTLWLWGNNYIGNLGTNDVISRSSPIQTVSAGTNWKQVSCGSGQTGAIKTDGTLWMWGLNDYGQLGTNDIISRSSPIQTVSGGTNWKQVSTSFTFTAAIKTDGTLWMWGRNNSGQLGTNDITNRSSPIQTVSAGTNWKQVSCGGSHSGAIKTDGTLWMWGINNNGNLGTNDTNSRSSPIQTVSAGTNWKQVSCGSGHSGAIKTDGTLWTWGYNLRGQLGINNTTNRSSPVQTVAGGTNWKQIDCGYFDSTAAIADSSEDLLT